MCILRQSFCTLGRMIICVAWKYIRRKETKKTEDRDAFSDEEHRHKNPVASIDYALINKSIIYFTTHKRKAPINMLSRSKAPKTQQLEKICWVSVPVKSITPCSAQGIIDCKGTETRQIFSLRSVIAKNSRVVYLYFKWNSC